MYKKLFWKHPAPIPAFIKLESFSLWGYALHTRGYFYFTIKVPKGVSKGTPLRYPPGQVTVKAGGANQNDAPSP